MLKLSVLVILLKQLLPPTKNHTASRIWRT